MVPNSQQTLMQRHCLTILKKSLAVTLTVNITTSNIYSSFKLCVECSDIAKMYNPELWPEGSIVWRYYEPHKAGVMGASTEIPTLGEIMPIGAMAALTT